MSTCKWYSVCPVNWFTRDGKLDEKWVKEYCLKGRKDCVRYVMEEAGRYHPDNMLPDGTIDKKLEIK
jgi:hypothetical protein